MTTLLSETQRNTLLQKLNLPPNAHNRVRVRSAFNMLENCAIVDWGSNGTDDIFKVQSESTNDTYSVEISKEEIFGRPASVWCTCKDFEIGNAQNYKRSDYNPFYLPDYECKHLMASRLFLISRDALLQEVQS